MKKAYFHPVSLYMLAGVVLLAGLGMLYFFDPLKSSFFPPCPFRALTHQYCPGCGSLRALHRLFHGDLSGAFAMNPLMVVSLPFLGALFIRPELGRKVWVPWACLIILVVYGVARNIPVWPFTWHAPH